jgi:glyoxylase-like metal-dependent hydrolase (beta-lactamase superfamily II)
MLQDDGTYELFAFRYARRTGGSKAREFYCYSEIYGEPDAVSGMDYFFWLARNQHRTVLIDCGMDREHALRHNRTIDLDAVEAIAKIGVAPSEIDHIVLSHLHFDHIGNADKFGNATFSVAEEELKFWMGPFADRPIFSWAVEAEEIAFVQDAYRQGRIRLVSGPETLFPGIRVNPIGGHTAGMMITEVDTSDQTMVLASDAIHFYEEMTLDRPFFIFSDLLKVYESYELLRSLDNQSRTTVVAGHDPESFSHFEPLDGELGRYVGRKA